MITNLVCSIVVSLVTNVSERFPQHEVTGPWPDKGGRTFVEAASFVEAVYYCHMEPDKDPKRKWVMTTIVQVEKLTFKYGGVDFEVTTKEQIVSQKEVEYSLCRKEDWIPAKP